MEQKPMRGATPLDPPTPEVARLYLDEVDRILERRADRVNLRAQGWITIVQGMLMAGFVGCIIIASHAGETTGTMLILMAFLMTTQILSGVAERYGGQRRFLRPRGLYYGAIVLACVAVTATFAMSLLSGDDTPLLVVLAPAGVGVLVLIGIGGCQLWLSRSEPRASRSERPPFVWPARGTTLALGALLGTMTIAAGYADALFTSLLTLLAGVALVITAVGSGADWGLAYLGEAWRWPQFLMLAVGAVAVPAGVLVSAAAVIDPVVFVLVGASIVAFATCVSLVKSSSRFDSHV